VAEFLKSIDYFVYFHHPNWVEALGIATVEAMAAGAIAVLPEYMRENFGSAAQYSTPDQSLSLVKSLHGNRNKLRQQRYRGLRYVKQFHSPSAYLDTLNGFLNRSAQTRPRRESSLGARRIMVIADFSDTGLHRFELYCMLQEIIQRCDEVVLFSSNAGKTSITNFWRNNPLLKARVRWREAATDIEVDLVIVDLPYATAASPIEFDRISCSYAVVILNELLNVQETQKLDNLLKENFRYVTWAPRSRTGRIHLEDLRLPELGIEPCDWEPLATSTKIAGDQKQRSEIFVICNSDIERSRSLKSRTIEALPSEAPCTIVELGRIIGDSPRASGTTFHFSPAELPPELMLRRAKIIIIAYHLTPPIRLIIDHARALGITILDVFSTDKGSIRPLQSSNHREYINGLWSGKKSVPAPGKKSQSYLSLAHSKGCIDRLVYWKCPETISLAASAHREVQPATAILMLSQNGVGLGHVVRQLAIARQINPGRKVVFCCIGQAFDIVRKHGYHVEHIPSHLYSDIPYHAWNRWLAVQLLQIIYFHKIGTIVFDGSTPYEGLLEALQSRPETKAVWIRRAMWTDAADVSHKKLRAGKLFDLVIEPQDLAEQYDTGPTPAFRWLTSRVKPISLVEPSDMLSREDSCLILGIDPNRTSVLLQLGSGNNRNLTLITDRIVAALAARGDFQIVESEWINSQFGTKMRPDIVRLRGFPTAIHFNTFDFCFSAAGYNSFHELISLGLPTIFIPNRREYMDNQLARATFASEKGAAINCDGSQASISQALDQVCLLPNRKSMQAAMRKLRSANGAKSAASLIERLAET
jgi:UDP:flavonoid glycosyltransferase YjiC (YdhE family)